MTDPIADMLTRIRNAQLAGQENTNVPYSKIKYSIAKVLKDNHYINDFKKEDNVLNVILRYSGKKPIISSIRRISKPGRRIYSKSGKLPKIKGGLGLVIVSTPEGLMTDKDARAKKLGGEILCEVW